MRRNAAFGDEVSRLWRKHLHTEFPERLRGQVFPGIDLVRLDADIAGCVGVWRAEGGSLGEDRRKGLSEDVENLDAVLPLLTSRVESLYFSRLRRLAAVVLESEPSAEPTPEQGPPT